MCGLEKARDVWGEFGDVPMNPATECIETPWNGFPDWFEDTFDVRVYDLMYQ